MGGDCLWRSFFELTADVFQGRFDRMSGHGGRAAAPSVRRPLRGLEVKEDTFAMIKVIDMMGREIKLYDSGSLDGKSSSYTNFILQSVTEPRNEKFQITETFGEAYLFLYGEQARLLDCSAILINSQDFNWKAEFWANYDEHLRGTKCAEAGARLYLFYDDTIVEGYMLNAVANNVADNPMAVSLQFRMFLTNARNVSLVGDPNFPVRLGVNVQVVNKEYEYKDLSTGERRIKRLRSLIHDNWDEWTGQQPPVEVDDNPDEVEDLIRAAVDEAAKNYADMNNADAVTNTGLDNANYGYGTGGPPPKQKPANPPDTRTSKDPSNCAPDTQETDQDGSIWCKTYDGTRIRIGYAKPANCDPEKSTPGCPEDPPPTPPGDHEAKPEPKSPPPPPNPNEGASGSGSGPPGEGTSAPFTSSVVASSCDPTQHSCG